MSDTERANDIFGYEITDLIPSEKLTVREIQTDAQRRFGELVRRPIQSGDRDELVRQLDVWGLETIRRFREAGYVVFVDPSNIELDKKGQPVLSPIIEFSGRVDQVEMDYDRASREVQTGTLDGIVGKIDANGIWREPDQQF
jgi:hypothetical protein